MRLQSCVSSILDPRWFWRETDMRLNSARRASLLPSVGRTLLLTVVVSLCLVLSTDGVGAQSVDDHGNFLSTATTLSLGSPVAGRISPEDDLDVFRLDLSSVFGATDVWIYTTGDFDTLGGLYDGNGEPIIFNDDSFIEGTGTNFHLRRNLSAGIFYVGVSSGDATTGDYTLHAQAVTDPGSATGTATPLNLYSLTPGTIDTTGDADYFRLDFTESTNLLLYVTNLILSDANYNPLPIAFLNGQVFDSTGSEISVNIYSRPDRFLDQRRLRPGHLLHKSDDTACCHFAPCALHHIRL